MYAKDYTINTASGRQLSLSEAGQADGAPVIVHHGTPSSRLPSPAWVQDAERRGIRLIGYNRPGYGESTPQPGRDIASVAEDVATIAKALGLERLCTWGISGGGPHALACAALLPDLVVAAAALGSPAPYGTEGLDWMAGMGEDNLVEFGAALAGRAAIEQYVTAATPALLGAQADGLVQALASLLSPVDAAVLTADFAQYLLARTQDALRAGGEGWIDDDLAFVNPWGFEVSQIRIPVMVMHGGQDCFVPFSHGQWLASHIPHVEARLLPEDGHLSLVARHIPEVHAWLLSKV
jgi:pimeloyl-ACP methyl ester carboxylesterase